MTAQTINMTIIDLDQSQQAEGKLNEIFNSIASKTFKIMTSYRICMFQVYAPIVYVYRYIGISFSRYGACRSCDTLRTFDMLLRSSWL